MNKDQITSNFNSLCQKVEETGFDFAGAIKEIALFFVHQVIITCSASTTGNKIIRKNLTGVKLKTFSGLVPKLQILSWQISPGELTQ